MMSTHEKPEPESRGDTSAQLAAAVHAGRTRWVLATSGGASRAVSTLLCEPGASQTILKAVIPYSTEALRQWIGGTPEQFVSDRTARAMAMAAYLRAKELAPDAGPLAGASCTASLASQRPKQGPHRAHLAVQTASMTMSVTLEIEKGLRDRSAEEDLTARLLLNLIAETSGVTTRLPLGLSQHELIDTSRVVACESWQDLLAGRVEQLAIGGGVAKSERLAMLPGAFNPLHAGHRRMAEVGAARLGCPVAWELSIANVDKPPLDFLEIAERVTQFGVADLLYLTKAPTFVRKASLFPGATFLVGADTIARIGDPRYYQNDAALTQRAIQHIAAQGCRFLVFGRTVADEFQSLADSPAPASLRALCDEVPAEEFRHDISSSELRRAAQS